MPQDSQQPQDLRRTMATIVSAMQNAMHAKASSGDVMRAAVYLVGNTNRPTYYVYWKIGEKSGSRSLGLRYREPAERTPDDEKVHRILKRFTETIQDLLREQQTWPRAQIILTELINDLRKIFDKSYAVDYLLDWFFDLARQKGIDATRVGLAFHAIDSCLTVLKTRDRLHCRISEINRDDLLAVTDYLDGQDHSASTHNKHVDLLCQPFARAFKSGLLTVDISLDLPRADKDTCDRVPYSLKELYRVRIAMDEEKPGFEWRMSSALMILWSVRPNRILGFREQALSEDITRAYFDKGRGNKTYAPELPIPSYLKPFIEQLIAHKGSDGKLFPALASLSESGLSQAFRRIITRANIKQTFHNHKGCYHRSSRVHYTFRHTSSYFMDLDQIPHDLKQYAMGHLREADATGTYQHYECDRLESCYESAIQLRKAVDIFTKPIDELQDIYEQSSTQEGESSRPRTQ